jgi:hypothetical protein
VYIKTLIIFRKENDEKSTIAEATKEVVGKYNLKITNLEDKYFKTQSELENCRTELLVIFSDLFISS